MFLTQNNQVLKILILKKGAYAAPFLSDITKVKKNI